MTLFEMSAAIASCDAAMVLEHVDAETRKRVSDRFGKSLARIAMNESPDVLEGVSAREALLALELSR